MPNPGLALHIAAYHLAQGEPDAALEMTDFDTLALTDEDCRRGVLCAQRRYRHAGNLDEYLTELGLVVEVAADDSYALPRVAHLIGKTNQFNLTGRWHGKSAARAFAESDRHLIHTMRVRDRFGDHELVGAAILATEDGATWTVDTLVVRCRVLGRGAETAFLSALAAAARSRDGTRLRGLFVASAKNAQVADLYPRHGFSPAATGDVDAISAGDAGTEVWIFDLTGEIAAPPWLTLTCAGEDPHADGYAPARIVRYHATGNS